METKGEFVVKQTGLERTRIYFLAGQAVTPFDFIIENGQINVMVCENNGSNKVHKVPLNQFSKHPPEADFLPPDKLALWSKQQLALRPRTLVY